MQSLAVAALILCGTTEWHDGSMVVLHNSNKMVAGWTDSEVTHVALVLNIDGQPWVYEATPGKVRRVPMASYREELRALNASRRRPTRMSVLQPKRPYSQQQVAKMRTYLDKQVGRRYSVKGVVRRKPSDGIHCAEYVATALAQSGRYRTTNAHSLHPATVVQNAAPLHASPANVSIRSRKSQESWCSRSWKQWDSVQTWCSWACYEAFLLCW
ncbi:MAG: YiiX/YebB-like N1pC/P60 family cysteine hydrolase [Pirellulaceae bacterium]|nr:YiiX/YebB-like N1pC/P60 family cysteine hydrolase [Pirellulaceae bacterium]